jgi:hypothetical protein
MQIQHLGENGIIKALTYNIMSKSINVIGGFTKSLFGDNLLA